jgi:hypothetical protein
MDAMVYMGMWKSIWGEEESYGEGKRGWCE